MSILINSKECGVNYKQSITPTNVNIGDTWFNTNTNVIWKYTGSEAWRGWIKLSDKVISGPGSNYGYNMGGSTGTLYLSTIDRITFPFDSGTSSAVGNLSGSRYFSAGCDGTDFVTLFV